MSKFHRRMSITPNAKLLGWRRLNNEAVSGQLKTFTKIPGMAKIQYIPYLKFDFITYHPALTDHWDSHYLGERDGVFIIMYLKDQSTSTGPML